MRTLSSLALLLLSLPAWSAPYCPPTQDQLGTNRRIADLILKAAQFGDKDRQTAKNFGLKTNESASVIEHRYQASGDLTCNNGKLTGNSQAQLVMRGDTILANAHGLHGGAGCDIPFKLKDCKFTTEADGKKVSYPIEAKLAGGWVCPNKEGFAEHKDWVILKLKKPVNAAVKPYQLTSPPCAALLKPVNAVSVAKSEDFERMLKPTESTYIAPRHYGRCQILGSPCPLAASSVMATDCDASHGASGGGLFYDEPTPKLFGLMMGIRDDCPEDAKAMTGAYHPRCYHSVAIPIAGELKEALEGLVKAPAPPEVKPAPSPTPAPEPKKQLQIDPSRA